MGGSIGLRLEKEYKYEYNRVIGGKETILTSENWIQEQKYSGHYGTSKFTYQCREVDNNGNCLEMRIFENGEPRQVYKIEISYYD